MCDDNKDLKLCKGDMAEDIDTQLQLDRIAELVKDGFTSGQEHDFAWQLTINQL